MKAVMVIEWDAEVLPKEFAEVLEAVRVDVEDFKDAKVHVAIKESAENVMEALNLP